MLNVLETIVSKLNGYWYKRNIRRALALHLRGEARRDGLHPITTETRLEIEWRARGIHPWDCPLLSRSQRAAVFVSQSLADTEAAVHRLFKALPQVNFITLRVLDHASETVIVSGTVSRLAASTRDEELSIGMRLLYLGLTYHSAGFQFEPLEDGLSAPAAHAGGVPAFRPEESLVNAIYRNKLDLP